MNLKFLRSTNILKVSPKLRICLFSLWVMIIITGCSTADLNLQNVKTNDTTKKETITSAIVGDSFKIYVALPKDYDSTTGMTYDVVYLLDGDIYFSETQEMIYDHVNDGDMKPVILVGIGNYDKRERDYSPTTDPNSPDGGGAKKFVNFLKTELIPHIDSSYRTISNPDNRCLVGHSLGGLCSFYASFFYNDTFHKFIAASSSLWWNDGIIFKYEEDYAASYTSLPIALYTTMCTGDYTINVYQKEMLDRLKSRNYSDLNLSSDTFEGISHVNSWISAFDKGLPILFKK